MPFRYVHGITSAVPQRTGSAIGLTSAIFGAMPAAVTILWMIRPTMMPIETTDPLDTNIISGNKPACNFCRQVYCPN